VSFASIAGERGLPSVSGAASMQSRISTLLAIGLMSVLGLGMLGWYYSRAITGQTRAQQSAQGASRGHTQGDVPLPSLGVIESPQILAAAPESGTAPAMSESTPTKIAQAAPLEVPSASRSEVAYAAAPGLPPPKSAAQVALERRLSGPAYSKQPQTVVPNPEPAADGATSAASESATGNPGAAAPAATIVPARSATLSTLLAPIATPAVQARVLPTQRLLLPKGAFIDCTLETAIDTTLPGMTTCITPTDTFSADGKVVLLERGTKLVGETQSEVQQGSSRVFVLWTEARTPTGVIVPLTSPGTDELGRAGVAGQVNRHFWDRFGAAILISVIDVALESSLRSGSGGAVIYGPSPAIDIMTEVLKGTLNIAPTVIKNQGDRIQVLVARDLDFRSVYELQAH
jgi:type IV secretion system protein VirB10